MTKIEKYNFINNKLENTIIEHSKTMRPILDTSLPFVKDSTFIKYIITSFFGYRKSVNGLVLTLDEAKKMELMTQYTNQIKDLKNSLTEHDSKLKELKIDEKKLTEKLKTFTKNDDSEAQKVLDEVMNITNSMSYHQKQKSDVSNLIKHYTHKSSKLRSNDKNTINYIAETLFIKDLIKTTYKTLDQSSELIEHLKEDIKKIDAIAKEQNVIFPIALLSQMSFNKPYRDIIEQLDTYNQILLTFIGIEIISDYMSGKIDETQIDDATYWDIPVINDILNQEEVQVYIDFIQKKYEKVKLFYLSKPSYFKRNDLLHIKSILQYVYKIILSPGATLIMAQELDRVKSTPLSSESQAIYLYIYNNLLEEIKTTIFKDEVDQDDFFKKYMMIILLSTTTPENLISRLEVF